MSIMKRLRDITVATLNEHLESAEDPVRLIDQYLAARREQLQQTERLYQQCVGHASAMRQQYLSALEMKEKREQQAIVALKAGEEEMARLVLHEKLQAEEKSEQYKKLYEDAQQSVLELGEEMKQIRADYQEVVDKRGYYLARMEAARLQQRMNERAGAFGTGSYGAARSFNRLEDRVSDMEMQAKTLRDVRRMNGGYGGYAQVNPAVDAELAALRQKLERGDG
ncbi:PspA/IM30 family protein [Paenibacillus chartarius]|uniref:PspA/IM30 family protein n=1 Tax=Paenibacillus chartarius TaxID=747481 RepID=A0ABV6DLA9_9BACL